MTKPTCIKPGCGRPAKARGLCNRDYERVRLGITPPGTPTAPTVNLPGEQWLPVIGYEGAYDVSDLGRARGLDRWVEQRGRRPRWYPGMILTQSLSSYGYLQIGLRSGGVSRTEQVHRLVARAFLGPRPPGMEVCHGVGGMLDNRAANLSYGTPHDNTMDKVRDGTAWWSDYDACPYGHALVTPNLIPSLIPRQRACLACSRARANLQRARRRGVELDHHTTADRHYAAIMVANASWNP